MNNLLIIGAGGHGQVVKEIAEMQKRFNKIDFLDDNSEEAIGKLSDSKDFIETYKSTFVAIGNDSIRRTMYERLEEAGYNIETIIHPRAYISPSVEVGKGSFIGANATVSTNAKLERGSIVTVGAIVDHDAIVKEYHYVKAGQLVKAGTTYVYED